VGFGKKLELVGGEDFGAEPVAAGEVDCG